MMYIMYIIIYMIIFTVSVRYSIRYRLKSTDTHCRYSKISYTDDERVSKLNKIWNTYPNSNEKLIFMHSFDGITNTSNFGDWKGYCDDKSSWPWCPASSALCSNWHLNLSGIKIPFPPLELPIESVSFSALNKHITPPEGEVIFNGDNASGLIFTYVNDKLISPMCYYPTDGMTVIRSNGGCGNLGLQMQHISLNEHGYKMNTTEDNMSGKEVYEKDESWTKYAKKYNPLGILLQKSLNVNQFLDVTRIKSEPNLMSDFIQVSHLNEVVFKSWRGVHFSRVPLFAFFHAKNAPNEIKEEIHEIAKLFEKNVKQRLPVVSFDQKNLSEPFALSKIDSLYTL